MHQSSAGLTGPAEAARGASTRLRTTPRHLLIVAHPDDEVLGATSLLTLDPTGLWIAHTTDGAPADNSDAHAAGYADRYRYARARYDESRSALELVRHPDEQHLWLGFPDLESAIDLVELTSRVAGVVRRLRPSILITHAYEGGHPDHDAAAFACWAACALVAPTTTILEFPEYHWTPDGVRYCVFADSRGQEISIPLDPVTQSLKRDMLARYRSQQPTTSQFPIDHERYRVQPRHDFRRKPHSGPCYRWFAWGADDGGRWRQLAATALEELGLA